MNVTDPIEKIIAYALKEAEVKFVHGSEGLTPPLDFYLPDLDIWIECKQFHTDRVAKQTASVEDIIVIQGRQAAIAFAKMLLPIRTRRLIHGKYELDYKDLWRMTGGAVIDAMNAHPEWFYRRHRHQARQSITKRVAGTLYPSFANRAAKGEDQPR